MKTWLCIICGLIYDEAKGWPDDGIAPVPAGRTCPKTGYALSARSAKPTLK